MERFRKLDEWGCSYFYYLPLWTKVTYLNEDGTIREKGIYFGWFKFIFYIDQNKKSKKI